MAAPSDNLPSAKPNPDLPSSENGEKPSLIVAWIIATSFFMEGLDSSIITTSLPQMAESLDVTPAQMSASITSYLLSVAVFIPISGWFADRFGARQVYCSAIAIFTLGSVLCGLSSSLAMLVVSRVIQGIGGAMMTPVGRLILTRTFPKDQLMRAMTYNMLPANIGPMLGPVLGGFITTNFSWHWNFFINVPLGFLGIALALRYIKDVQMPRPAPFDLAGFFIVAGGLISAQFLIGNLAHGTLSISMQTILFVLTVILFGGYGYYAAHTENPILDLKMFRIRPFAIAVLVGGVWRMAIYPMTFLVALLLQLGFGLDPFETGLITFLFTLGALTMRTNVVHLVRWVGIRRLLLTGSIISTLMIIGFSLFTPETPHALLGIYFFCFGMMRNAQNQSIAALTYAEIPDEHMSKGTTIAALIQRGFQSLGVGLVATLLAAVVGDRTAEVSDFLPVFLILSLLPALTALGFARLRPNDGWQISGHRPK